MAATLDRAALRSTLDRAVDRSGGLPRGEHGTRRVLDHGAP